MGFDSIHVKLIEAAVQKSLSVWSEFFTTVWVSSALDDDNDDDDN